VADAAYAVPVRDVVIYTFDGARYSNAARRILGFRTVSMLQRESLSIEKYLLTDACERQLIWRSHSHSVSDVSAMISYSIFEPEAERSTQSGPYTCHITKTSEYECERTSTCRLARERSISYDRYGNVEELLDTADQAVPRRSNTYVYPNLTDYIVDRPGRQEEREFVGGSWTDPTKWSTRKLTLYEYDTNRRYDHPPGSLGELRRILAWEPVGTGQVYRQSTLDYDARGNVIKTTNPAGIWQRTSYDTRYELWPLESCNARFCTSRKWDEVLGTVRSETDVNGQTSTYAYDAHGRPIRIDYPDGSFQITKYLASGVITGPQAERQRIRTERSDGSTGDGVLYREVFFDGLGRTYMVAREGGAVQEYRYGDASSRPAAVSHPYQPNAKQPIWTTYQYDAVDRLTVVTAPDGSTQRTEYKVGSKTKFNELNQQRQAVLDGRGQIVAVTEFQGSHQFTTLYSYDALSRLRTVTDHEGNVSSIVWDSHSRQVETVDPDRGRRKYTYFPDGQLKTVEDAKGQLTRLSYDDVGRRERREEVDTSGAITRLVTWRYDTRPTSTGPAPSGHSLGRLVLITDEQLSSSNSELRQYDEMGRIDRTTKCVEGRCVELGYAFDGAGRLKRLTYPDEAGTITSMSETVDYKYDDAGRPTSVGGYITGMTYDPDDQPTNISYGNGVAIQYSYDDARRWLDWVYIYHPSRPTHYWAQYDHEPTARIQRLRTQNHTWVDLYFEYDAIGRLEKVISPNASYREEFRYDALGRLRHSSRDGTHEYLDTAHVHAVTQTTNGSVRQYDVNGNLERVTDPSGRNLEIEWTHDGRPALIRDVTAGSTIRSSYDVSGHRIIKHRSAAERIFYFGPLIEFAEPAGFIKYYYVGNQLVARRDAVGIRYYHDDVTRSTRLETNAAGEVVNRYDYSAYGIHLLDRGAVPNDVAFAGNHVDDETGLVYMNDRYYDPVLAQFISADNIVPDPSDPQYLNRYAYARNDPINFSDPSGHVPVSWRVQLKKEIESRGRGYSTDFNYMCGGPFAGAFGCCFFWDENIPLFLTTTLTYRNGTLESLQVGPENHRPLIREWTETHARPDAPLASRETADGGRPGSIPGLLLSFVSGTAPLNYQGTPFYIGDTPFEWVWDADWATEFYAQRTLSDEGRWYDYVLGTLSALMARDARDQTMAVLNAAGFVGGLSGVKLELILETAIAGKSSKPGMGSAKYTKTGGLEAANRDFDIIAGANPIKDHGNGIRSTSLLDGTTVSVRPSSGHGAPTVQVNPPSGNPIKIRYETR
jgi:RHS repeat-associated protein